MIIHARRCGQPPVSNAGDRPPGGGGWPRGSMREPLAVRVEIMGRTFACRLVTSNREIDDAAIHQQ